MRSMLIRFTVENWMSYRDRATLTMLASREKQHRQRIAKLQKYGTSVLPITMIYGGNASGKTNFFKALHFVRTFIVRGTEPDGLIPVESFRMDKNCLEKPTRFVIELLVEEMIYEFCFAVTPTRVVEERLTRINRSSETVLYDRNADLPNFAPEFAKDEFLRFAFRGTRDNQLFLTNSVSQKVDTFRPVYDWFQKNLEMIAPDSRFQPFEQFIEENTPLYSVMNSTLHFLDTGITHLGGEEIAFDNANFTENQKTRIRESLKDGDTKRMTLSPSERYILTRDGNEIITKKLYAYHKATSGQEERFEMRQESDGTQRVIDLLPAFLNVTETDSTKVYVIDELDRSLHTLLTRRLIESYLNQCSPDSRTQMLITTHDVLLMDQDLFRRDEMWITERSDDGNTSLIPFSDYKDVRYDKDIRKSYLQGRLGGIPKILLGEIAACQKRSEG